MPDNAWRHVRVSDALTSLLECAVVSSAAARILASTTHTSPDGERVAEYLSMTQCPSPTENIVRLVQQKALNRDLYVYDVSETTVVAKCKNAYTTMLDNLTRHMCVVFHDADSSVFEALVFWKQLGFERAVLETKKHDCTLRAVSTSDVDKITVASVRFHAFAFGVSVTTMYACVGVSETRFSAFCKRTPL